ncbi:MAG: Zn-ribbon domain-containing OB-fold protein [Actinomycetota bacterium]
MARAARREAPPAQGPMMRGVPPAEVIWLSPSPSTEPFWRATAEHRLVLPRCTACATFRLPPTPFCFRCRAQEVEWVDHDGRGEIYSFTVVRHAVIPALRDALPLVAAVVELPGTNGCRLVGSVVDCEPEVVHIGAPVTLDWYDVREGTTIPVFRLA